MNKNEEKGVDLGFIQKMKELLDGGIGKIPHVMDMMTPTHKTRKVGKRMPAGAKLAKKAWRGELTMRHKDGVIGSAIRQTAKERRMKERKARVRGKSVTF